MCENAETALDIVKEVHALVMEMLFLNNHWLVILMRSVACVNSV